MMSSPLKQDSYPPLDDRAEAAPQSRNQIVPVNDGSPKASPEMPNDQANDLARVTYAASSWSLFPFFSKTKRLPAP